NGTDTIPATAIGTFTVGAKARLRGVEVKTPTYTIEVVTQLPPIVNPNPPSGFKLTDWEASVSSTKLSLGSISDKLPEALKRASIIAGTLHFRDTRSGEVTTMWFVGASASYSLSNIVQEIFKAYKDKYPGLSDAIVWL